MTTAALVCGAPTLAPNDLVAGRINAWLEDKPPPSVMPPPTSNLEAVAGTFWLTKTGFVLGTGRGCARRFATVPKTRNRTKSDLQERREWATW